MSKDTSPSAFPIPIGEATQAHMYNRAQHGMSLRDYFAGQALAGFMGNSETRFTTDTHLTWQQKASKQCYLVADAMLEARKDEI